MRKLLALAALALPSVVPSSGAGAQAAPPSTDIWLAPLAVRGDSLIVGAPRNVTRREGYDNQPSFTPDSRAILYTARVDGQTDIFRHEVATGRTTRLTTTAESEYSPTVMPGGTRFSVVRVEADSTQRLWSFAMDGSDPRLVLPGVRPVGYHAWVDDSTVALFVLGSPATLQMAHLRTGGADTLARDIARGVYAPPGGAAPTVAFIQRDSAGTLALETWPVVVRARAPGEALPTRPVGDERRRRALPAGAEFLAFAPGGQVLTAAGSTVYVDRGGGWQPVAELSGLRNASRLAVSPDGRWLAIVAEPTSIPVTKER